MTLDTGAFVKEEGQSFPTCAKEAESATFEGTHIAILVVSGFLWKAVFAVAVVSVAASKEEEEELWMEVERRS